MLSLDPDSDDCMLPLHIRVVHNESQSAIFSIKKKKQKWHTWTLLEIRSYSAMLNHHSCILRCLIASSSWSVRTIPILEWVLPFTMTGSYSRVKGTEGTVKFWISIVPKRNVLNIYCTKKRKVLNIYAVSNNLKHENKQNDKRRTHNFFFSKNTDRDT